MYRASDAEYNDMCVYYSSIVSVFVVYYATVTEYNGKGVYCSSIMGILCMYYQVYPIIYCNIPIIHHNIKCIIGRNIQSARLSVIQFVI